MLAGDPGHPELANAHTASRLGQLLVDVLQKVLQMTSHALRIAFVDCVVSAFRRSINATEQTPVGSARSGEGLAHSSRSLLGRRLGLLGLLLRGRSRRRLGRHCARGG